MFLGTPDPVAFTLFGIEVRWYGILIALGMLLGVGLAYRRANRYGIKEDNVLDVALFAMIFGVIGARLYYVIFNWEYYGGDIRRILNIRSGGLAIHGGIIFGLLTVLIVCRIHRDRFIDLTDLLVPSLALAQSIGRWGNYCNGEAHGGPTDLPWAINVGGEMVHPTFLYESLWCFLLCLFLLWMARRQKFSGQIALLYFILYSFERFFVEGLRTDSLMLGGLRMAQVLSAAVFVVCLALYFVLRKRGDRGRSLGYHR